jgi:nitrogen fixation NifU-like protein
MDLYADQILDHYKNPRHAGPLAGAQAHHEEVNLSCGDRVKIETIVDGNGVLADIGWTGSGCAISQASMSLLAEKVVGRPVEELLALKKPDVLELLGVPVSERRMKCALLGLHALQNALRLEQGISVRSWAETVADPPIA